MFNILSKLGAALDAISWLFLRGAALAIAAIVAATAWDVMLRYFFNRPTEWVGDTVGFFLCAAIFLAAPEVARRRGHVTIAILLEMLPPSAKLWSERAIYSFSGVACLLAAWICGTESLRQFTFGIQTVGTFTIPKWWVSGFIVIGFAFTALQFFRLAVHITPFPGSRP
jgi:TRAP-type C4-dicarboxylate transport system permease small subunit